MLLLGNILVSSSLIACGLQVQDAPTRRQLVWRRSEFESQLPSDHAEQGAEMLKDTKPKILSWLYE